MKIAHKNHIQENPLREAIIKIVHNAHGERDLINQLEAFMRSEIEFEATRAKLSSIGLDDISLPNEVDHGGEG